MDEELSGGDTRGQQPDESAKERVDRELSELLEEIRVILPGVEILFGFLIILPFEFSDELTGLERLLYLGAFLSVSAGLALLVSPTVTIGSGSATWTRSDGCTARTGSPLRPVSSSRWGSA